MHNESLIHDVLSFLPEWGLKDEYESKPVQDYEHGYMKAFLEDTQEDKDQLYVSKRVTAQEIYEEFRNTEIKIKSYTHREELPHDPDMYYGLCKYTAGSLFLKYTQEVPQKTHGNCIRRDALDVIDPYVVINVHDVGHGSPRRVRYPKWFLDTQKDPFWMSTPPLPYQPPLRRPDKRPPREAHGKQYSKPYIIVETRKQHHYAVIQTEKIRTYKAHIETKKLPRKCHNIPFSAREKRKVKHHGKVL